MSVTDASSTADYLDSLEQEYLDLLAQLNGSLADAPLPPPTAGETLAQYFDDSKKIYVPLVCVCGLFGNCLGLTLIWSDSRLRRIASNIHLSTLAISASTFLVCLFLHWTEHMTDMYIYRQKYGCKLFTWLSHCADFMVSWAITSVSFERVVVLYRLKCFYRNAECGRSVEAARKGFAKRLTTVLLVLALIVHSWIIPTALPIDITSADGSTHVICAVDPDYSNVYSLMVAVETVIQLIIPALLITIFTLAAIHRYRQCLPHVSHVRFQKQAESIDATASVPPTTLGTTASHLRTGSTACNGHTVNARIVFSAHESRLTRTLLTLTSLFLLLNLPLHITRLLRDNASQAVFSSVWFVVFDYVGWLLYYAHYAILFYLYIFWTPKMRKQVRPTALRLLECYCLKPVPDSSWAESHPINTHSHTPHNNQHNDLLHAFRNANGN